uniref:POP4 homolog, ribonuclease P/MRP subunit n=1 Tax=Equus asinus asinus TaxID=83772 RepID=A0A8C4N1V3_EQUAS
MQSVIYHAFSQKEAKELDVQHLGAQRAEAFVRAFLKRSTPRMSQQAREDQLQRKAVVLEYFTRRKRKEKKRKSRGLSARQRRALRLFDIKPEQQRYSLFLPLHELWKQYIRDLCNGLKPDTQPQLIQAKLLKADLHGAIVSGELPASTCCLPSHHSGAAWCCVSVRHRPCHVDILRSPARRVGGDCGYLSQFWPLVGCSNWSLCTFPAQGPLLVSQRAQQLRALTHGPES